MAKLVFLFLILASVFTGCVNESDIKKEELGPGLNIKLMETLDKNSRSLLFLSRTAIIYPCINYHLVYDMDKTSRSINILFTSVAVPDICLTALGPATAQIPVGNLNEGNYSLRIGTPSGSLNTELSVTSESFIVKDVTNGEISFDNIKLNRVPANTIWGYIGYYEDPINAGAVLDSLTALGAVPKSYLPGDYYFFKINNSGTIDPPQDHGYRYVIPFIFNYTGDIESFKPLLKYYKKEYDFSIALYNDKGEVLYSWVLANESTFFQQMEIR